MWRYTGKVIKGRKDALITGDSYLGPTLHLIRNERVRVHFVNNLAEPSIIHWHGLIVPHAADGLPSMAIKPKERKTYDARKGMIFAWIDRTIWLKLAFFLHILATAAAALMYWMEKGGRNQVQFEAGLKW